MTPVDLSINEAVQRHMDARGLSQMDLAQLLGLHLTTIGGRLRGTRGAWKAAELALLAEAWSVPLENLMGRRKGRA